MYIHLKPELWAAMRENGFDNLFSINSQTLSATVKELITENGGVLPEWLDGLIKIAEKNTIRIIVLLEKISPVFQRCSCDDGGGREKGEWFCCIKRISSIQTVRFKKVFEIMPAAIAYQTI